MNLADVTWTDVADGDARLAVLPIGSTEQHGPHAPLGTDSIIAEAIAEAGATTYDESVLIAPTVPIGVAEEHRAFDGTMWVSPATFRNYVREAVASLAAHGITGAVLVNGHGGNDDALREVAARLSRDDVCRTVTFTWFEAVDIDSAAREAALGSAVQMGHAGPLETAIVRSTRPDLIREDRLEAAAAGASDRWGEWAGGVNLSVDSDQFTENGVVGDPRVATTDLGSALLQQAGDQLASILRELDPE